MSKKKRIIRIILWVVLGLVVLSVFVAIFKKANSKSDGYELLTATPNDTITKSTILTGSIEPRDLVQIKPKMSGIIVEIYKQPGEMVNEGDIIARIGVIPELSSVQAAQSRVQTSKINRDRLQEVFARDEKLYNEGILPEERYQESKSALEQSKIDYNSAVEALQLASTGSSASTRTSNNTLVRATVSGLLLEQPVKVGQSVTQSNNFSEGTTVASIANLQDLLFIGKVNEADVVGLKVGAPVKVTIGALEGRSYNGVIEYVSPKGSSTNGAVLFEVKAAITDSNLDDVRAGFSSNAEVIIDNRNNVLTLPERAIEWEDSKTYVYVSKNGGSNDADFEKREIKIGLSDGIKVEVISGLKEGEQVRGSEL